MKNNIIYSSVFLVITIVGIILLLLVYETNYANFNVENIEILLNNEYWTNDNVTVSVDYTDNISVKAYSFDGGKTWQKENSYVAKNNEKLEIVLRGTFGKRSKKVEYRVSNIDKQIPNIEVADIIYIEVGKSFKFTDYYTVSDQLSGLKTLSVMNYDNVDINKIGEYEVSIEATDIAGNITSKTVKISVVDAKNPNLPQNQKNKIAVTGITVDKTKVSLVKGTKLKVNATIKPGNATNKKVIWESSDINIAKVNSKGEITAVNPGSTTVIVKTEDDNKMSEISVIVTEEPVEVSTVSLDRKSDRVTTANENIVLTVTVKPEIATTANLKWSSSNTSVATVKNGIVTVKGEGDATITVKSNNGKVATYHLIVKDNYAFQQRAVTKKGEVTGYEMLIYKNGVNITGNVTEITSPITVKPNSKKQLVITTKQNKSITNNIVIVYENNKYNVKRGQ